MVESYSIVWLCSHFVDTGVVSSSWLFWMTHVQVSVWSCFHFPWACTLESSGAYSNYKTTLWRDCQTVSPEGCAIFRSHQQCKMALISPYPYRHWVFCIFLVRAILLGVKWSLIVASICISLMTSDVEHLFLCLLAIRISSFVKYLLTSFGNLKVGLFVFLLTTCLLNSFSFLGMAFPLNWNWPHLTKAGLYSAIFFMRIQLTLWFYFRPTNQ